ncbi:MAG: hypothetical protein ACXWPM_02840 [Bdellovibrionota bacterium]
MRAIVETGAQRTVIVDLEGYDRIRARTPERVNEDIALEIEEEVRDISRQNKAVISERIGELDREWDVDRAIMMVVSTIGGLGLTLGLLTRNRRWFIPVGVQLGFLALHATIGWCPPAMGLRSAGFRSRFEIDAEKYALKTVRGDFIPNAREAA